MNKSKRIFGILMSFVMVFSIFAGNLSYADTSLSSNTVKYEHNVKIDGVKGGGSGTAYLDLGLKLKKSGNSTATDIDDVEELEKKAEYTVEYNTEKYVLNSIDINNKNVKSTSFKVPDTNEEIFIMFNFRNKSTSLVEIKVYADNEQIAPSNADLEINGKKFAFGDEQIYLTKSKDYPISYNTVDFKFDSMKIDGVKTTSSTINTSKDNISVEIYLTRVTDNRKITVDFKAPTEIKNKIKISSTIENFVLNKEIKIKEGDYTVTFTNIPEDYEVIVRDNGGIVIEKDKSNSTKTKSVYKIALTKTAKVEFGLKSENYKVLIDAPRISSNNRGVEEFNVYTTPSTEVNIKLMDTVDNRELAAKTVKTDLNGKATVKLENTGILTSGGVIVKATAESNNLVAENSVKITSETTKLEVKADEINIGDKKITGTSTGASVKAYIYNTSTKKFTELSEAKVSNGKFEIEHKTGFVNDDQIYIKALNSEDEGVYTVIKTASSVERLYGSTRFITAVKIAKESYPTTDAVVIANGYVSADALAAGPLANELNAPILLVEKDFVAQDVVSYIEESGATKIYIAGGPNSVSDKVITNIKPSASTKTERIYGTDRYETSLKIAEKLVENHNYNKSVIFANGLDDKDADALAASTYATQSKQAIILSRNNATTDKVKAGLKDLNITSAEIVGGPKTLSDKAVTDAGLTLGTRTYGDNRYETSVAIAEKLENVNSIIIANGYKSADALTAASLAKTKNAAILLSAENSITNSQTEFIKSKKPIGTLYIAGGPKSVFDTLEKTLEDLIK
ncbi:cell wall-binding repeat-containing protein [Miniphocaeibacter halophilus]|uniref:Cell wall-binding repeat-containing protein n=1 Tax=Miniphocaeibacter halophilus TaxID=2931922 RepID=A0AC61MS19_9FIRM|nr:cell wall-binding repeat-containing protein [Miniphocaeibacter halophilus]QQK08222.1 cell wall-binding repeat-containing protein [Miniphocaeibacter halophilus]